MEHTDKGVQQLRNPILIIVVLVLLVGIWQIRSVIILALAGMMLTILFSMPVRFFMRFGVGRLISILLSLTIGGVAVTLLGWLLFPTLISQFVVLFTATIPNGINRLIEMWNTGELYEQIPALQEIMTTLNTDDLTLDSDSLNQIVSQITGAINRLGGSLIPILGEVANALLSLFIVVFVCIYLIIEPDKYLNGVIRLTPIWYRERMLHILQRIDKNIRAWIKVVTVSMLFIGTVTAIGLAFVGVQQWLALGVLAGLLSFVPNFGMFATLVPTVAVTIVQVPEAIWVVVAVVVISSFIQAQILGPILTSEAMNLPPVLILIGQIILGVFFGFMGLMLAVPLMAIIVILVEEIYIHDILGDDGVESKQNSSLTKTN